MREAVRVARIGIFDHDQVADTIFWSQEQRAIYGVGPDEPITLELFLGFLRSEDSGRIGEAVQRAHDPDGDGRFDVEHGIVRRDGGVRWLRTRSQTFFAGEGAARRPVRTIGAVIDVTEERTIAAEQAALRRVAEAVAARTEPGDTFALIALEVAVITGAEAAGVVRFGAEREASVLGAWPAAGTAANAVEAAVRRFDDDGPPPAAMRDGQVHHSSVGVAGERALARVGPSIAVPVRVAQSVWGALIVVAPPGSVLPEGTGDLIADFAHLTAISISEASAWERARQRDDEQEALRLIGERALAVPLAEALAYMADVVAATLGATWVEVCGADGPGEPAVPAAIGAQPSSAGAAPAASGVRAAATRIVIDDGPFLSSDIRTDPRFAGAATGTGVGGVVAGVPIGMGGDLWGALVVGVPPQGRAATGGDLVFLGAVANIVHSAIARARAEEALRHQAMHDSLTGLANRALLLDRLSHAISRGARAGRRTAVIFCDIDHFKDVNDALGHGAADRLLVQVADRLTAVVRPGDTVARLGGDEFVVVCEDLLDESTALTVAYRVLESFAKPFDAGEGLSITASVGIAVCGSERDADEVLRDADTAMYRAKRSRSGRVEIFDEAMREHLLARIRTGNDIRHGLDRDEFFLHYQPLVALASGEMIGVEALVRWQHPTRGAVGPSSFIPIAEEIGAIVELGQFVIRRACADAAGWNALRPDGVPLEVSVNISPRQLSDASLVDVVRRGLEEWSLPAGQLGVEITESVMLDDDPEHLARVEQIRALGVRLLLDDFGTGYSSLSYVQRLSFDALKVDRSFVAGLGENLRDSTIVAAIVRMAQALDVQVIVEGVETTAQAAALELLGCRYAQGFHFARPVAAETIGEWLPGEGPWRGRMRLGGASGALGEPGL